MMRINKNYFTLLFLFLLTISTVIGQENIEKQINEVLATNVINGYVNYEALKENENFKNLVASFTSRKIGDKENISKSFYINAYNLGVIQKIVAHYPIQSVQEVNRFFDKSDFIIHGKSYSLNEWEKEALEKFKDPRLHFAFVCGAKGCPKMNSHLYASNETAIEEQLNAASSTTINDSYHVFSNEDGLRINKIFDWYKDDFLMEASSIQEFLNQYLSKTISSDQTISYNEYDWGLNALLPLDGTLANGDNSAYRYIVSSTIPEKSWEIKLFNNLYSQKFETPSYQERATFFTQSITALYGFSKRINIGVAGRFRKVAVCSPINCNAFQVFGKSTPETRSRIGVTALGPMIRFAPVPKWSNFSIQSSFTVAIGKNLKGTSDLPFIDWQNPVWNTQFFNDYTINSKWALFTEIDLLFEDIGNKDHGAANLFSTPITGILSYFPTKKSTLYTLVSYSPTWNNDFNYFYQFGLASKYQITSQFEVELLYTYFNNKFLSSNNGLANTYNLGFRFTL